MKDLQATRYMGWLLAERRRRGGGAAEDALSAAVAFEAELVAYAVGALPISPEGGTNNPGELLEQGWDAFYETIHPISESYRAKAAWLQLCRYDAWARRERLTSLPTAPDLPEKVKYYREKLEYLSVRKYWGPRG